MTNALIHIETLGCKLNQTESESIAERFIESGFLVDMKPITAENALNKHVFLSIVNTCTVTGKAEQKARRIIRLLLNSYTESVVIVTGCYAEVEKNLIEQIDERVIAIPGTQKDMLSELPKKLIADFPQNTREVLNLLKEPQKQIPLFSLTTKTFTAHTRSSLKIQDGCSGECTYCRIRFARGKNVSLPPQQVLERVLLLEKSGHTEVVLLGVNLALYESESYNLAKLLHFLLQNTTRIFFRISSLHPQSITDELCKVLAHERVRPHFHLSVQSGSSTILAAMKRPYTTEVIYEAVCKLRRIKNNPFIACDIIVGFPNETEADFEQTYTLCKKCNFSWIHVFQFSARPQTPAFTMKNQIDSKIAALRAQKITTLAIEQKKHYIESFVGKSVYAIIEKRRSQTRAVTENFLHVLIPSLNSKESADLAGKQIPVRILGIANSLKTEEIEAYAELV